MVTAEMIRRSAVAIAEPMLAPGSRNRIATRADVSTAIIGRPSLNKSYCGGVGRAGASAEALA